MTHNAAVTSMGLETSALAVAERLARALDSCDFDAASKLLDPACRYELRDEVLVGPDAIVASYAANDRAARTRFDALRYESSVATGGDDVATIEYADHLVLGGRAHTHRCRQHITVSPAGRIVRIVHEDIAGERERLERFLAAGAIAPPSVGKED